MARIKLTDNARPYRRGMWFITIVAGLPAMLLAIRGAQGRVPVTLGLLGALVFVGAIVTAAVLGLKAHRQTLADREIVSRRTMIVMMTATLGKESDESLEKIHDGGGLTGEAAGMILKSRQAKANAQADG
jgi:hypothetical protein